jgi:hypothetical protein
MRVNEYKIISEAVERGVNWGFIRSTKYAEEPSLDAQKDEIVKAVMLEICDNFIFSDIPEQAEQE